MPLNLIFNADSPTQDGLLESFLSQGAGIDQEFVRGDVQLGISLRPVVPSVTSTRPWDDCNLPTDTYQVAIGNPDTPPTGGDWPIGIFAGTIVDILDDNPTVITTASAHNLVDGDTVIITGSNSIPTVNGTHIATVTGANTFTLPINVLTAGNAGTVYDAEGMGALDYQITAAAFQAIISPLSVKHGYSAVIISLLAEGNYNAEWQGNGAVPALYSPEDNDLIPDSSVAIIEDNAGSASTKAIQIIVLNQQPVAFCEPSTQFPAASVTATIEQAGSATANKIYSLSFVAGTYGGTFSVALTLPDTLTAITDSSVADPSVITVASTADMTTGQTVNISGHVGSTPDINGDHVITKIDGTTFSIPVDVTVGGTGGIAYPLVTETVGVTTPSVNADNFNSLLQNHTLATPTSFQVTVEDGIITTEFRGDFLASNLPVMAVTNIDILAPLGVSGVINLNTVSLYRAFINTSATTLNFTFAVKRFRASGEEAELFQHTVTLKRSLINPLTMIPVALPSYYTAAQVDAIIAELHDYFAESTASTEEIEITKLAKETKYQTIVLTCEVLGAPYQCDIVLSILDCEAGDISEVVIVFPAATDPTVDIFNDTSAGTALTSDSNPSGTINSLTRRFVYTGTAWILIP